MTKVKSNNLKHLTSYFFNKISKIVKYPCGIRICFEVYNNLIRLKKRRTGEDGRYRVDTHLIVQIMINDYYTDVKMESSRF